MKICTKCKQEKDLSDFNKDRSRKDGFHNNCKECRKIDTKKYREDNKEKIKQTLSQWYLNNKVYINQYNKNKYHTDINYKLGKNLRTRINLAVKNNNKANSTKILIGCSIEYLKQYLQNKFVEGMNWDNYGEWHIDHIKPCAKFDLSKELEQRACFNYSNLQPLWAEENWSKGDKILI
jgi:hypothetical protein